jgi:hypothetical protein
VASVFIEDIDRFLIQNINLQGYVPSEPTDTEYPNWKLDTVPVTYHIPEGGIAPEFEHNLVTFYLYDMQLDTDRTQSDIDLIVSQDETANTITTKKVPVPYMLFYQIDLWSLKQSNLVKMISKFQSDYAPRTSILVPDEDGEVHDLFMEMRSSRNADGALWDNGSKQTNERFFRRIFRYCVYAELDSSPYQTNQRVKEVVISDPNTI